uniref:Uncharacterized protein n=1 Tax=Parastrongyloides trichosuri TaxID=131310 RepID=A0A0N4ZGH6_PARTI
MEECEGLLFCGDWEIDDCYEEREKVKKLDIENFRNFKCIDGWFLEDENIGNLIKCNDMDERDVKYYKLSHYYQCNENENVMNVLKELSNTDISPAGKYARWTSIFKVFLEEGKLTFNELKDMLRDNIEIHVKSLGEQIGVWEMTVGLYQKFSESCENEHFKNLILLTSLNDFSSYWLLFDHLKGIVGENFYLGCKCRAMQLLFNEAEASKGFLKEIKMKRYHLIRDQLITKYGKEKVLEAQKEMCKDIQNTNYDLSEEMPPPHACKMDGCIKTEEQMRLMISNFISRYPYIFINVSPPHF